METLYEKASLILNPGVYDSGKVYATKPFDGSGDLTFTRASNATRVASNGLIEKVRTNLLTYSNTFTDATWVKTSATITANDALSPDGTTNASKYEGTNATNAATKTTTLANGLYTFSIFVKRIATDNFRMNFSDGSTGEIRYVFNLSNQTSTTTKSGGSISDFSTTYVAYPNGWYRLSIAARTNAGTTIISYFEADNEVGSFYVYGAQLEQGDVMTDYIATTTAAVSVGPVSGLPRLDYLNSSCPRLLLEPQRTNLVRFSEQIDNAGWAKTNAPTITTNIATAPDGYGGADGIQDTTGGAFKRIRQTFSVTANGTHTASVFVKKETSETNYGGIALVFSNRWAYGIIDAVNGTLTVSSDSIIASSSTKVEDYGTYWRFSLTVTDNQSNTTLEIAYYGTLSVNGTSTGVAAGSVRTVWGFQLEIGASYSSSYIPNLNTLLGVTRVADVASKTGISSLIGQTEGAFYAEWEVTQAGSANSEISVSNGTNSTAIRIRQNANNRLQFIVIDGGVTQASLTTAFSVVVGSTYKIAGAYMANDFVMYVNGVQIGTDTSGTVPACSQFGTDNGAGAGNGDLFAAVKQALLFKTRLTNAQLAELTA
jgi:hypothetical protein